MCNILNTQIAYVFINLDNMVNNATLNYKIGTSTVIASCYSYIFIDRSDLILWPVRTKYMLKHIPVCQSDV